MKLGPLWFTKRWMRLRVCSHYALTLNVLTPKGLTSFTIASRADSIAAP